MCAATRKIDGLQEGDGEDLRAVASALRTDGEAREVLVSHLYEIAVDPARYDGLVEWWENVVHPVWPDDPEQMRLDFDVRLEAHFQRATALLDQAESRSPSADKFAALLDVFRARSAFVVDANLIVRAATPPALERLGVQVGEALPTSRAEARIRGSFQAALYARLASGPSSTGVYRLVGAAESRPMVVYLRRQVMRDGTLALLVVVADFVWQDSATDTLRAAFGLTLAEADVARLVAEGFSAKEIARHRSAATETVRKQLRAVFQKTNTRSQVELSRVVLSVADIAVFTDSYGHVGTATRTAPATLPALPFLSCRAADGRRLEYVVLGDPQGRAVLHLAQDYGFIRLPASAEADAARRGLRLITPVPAGYGGSEPHPTGADYAKTSVADVLAVLDCEGVAVCPILASMMTYHAVNLITTAPERFSALVQVPATFPLETRVQFERMDKWHRFINGAARYTPGVLPFLVKAGFHLARRLGKRDFLHAVYGASPGDMATIADPEALEALVVGSEVALGPGCNAHHAFAQQVVARVAESWADGLRALEGTLPIVALQGVHDPYCPPETLAEMRATYPWMQIETVDNAGELIVFSHWRRALELIEPYA